MVVEQRPSERGVAKAKAEAWVQPKMVVGLSPRRRRGCRAVVEAQEQWEFDSAQEEACEEDDVRFNSPFHCVYVRRSTQSNLLWSSHHPRGKWALDDSSTSQPQQREECEENPSTSTIIGVAIHHHHQRRATAHDDSVF
uniref:Uncharacterized protein n=1 Tax=Vitis vinifera TaxID=29760 RepID=A5AZE9_VITVI|nr:hypothetical protein VITISV_011928 [Vitis vinifera]